MERTKYFTAFSFFFQAEDGIRDYKVTGVQTCALPISVAAPSGSAPPTSSAARTAPDGCPATVSSPRPAPPGRSEERRVGKECRSRWSRCCWVAESGVTRRLWLGSVEVCLYNMTMLHRD